MEENEVILDTSVELIEPTYNFTGVKLMRVDDSVEIEGLPSRTVLTRLLHAANNARAPIRGTVYQAIDEKIPGNPYLRPVLGAHMNSHTATNFRIEDDAVVCDIEVIRDSFMGKFLSLQQGVARATLDGGYMMNNEARTGLIIGGGPNLPPKFVIGAVHVYLDVPVPRVEGYWSDFAEAIQEHTPSHKTITQHGGVPTNSELGGLGSQFLDALSNYVDNREFFLINGTIAELDTWHPGQDVPEDVIEAEVGVPPNNDMLKEYQTLATNIGGVNGREMFTSGDVVVIGETEDDFWVFWYAGAGENNNKIWRVARALLRDVDGPMELHSFIQIFHHEMRLNYEGWRGRSKSRHPIIVEIPMPIDGTYHTKHRLMPVLKRGASWNVATS